MKIRAEGLPATTSCMICADNNPFFEIHRGAQNDSGQFFKVYDSDIAQGTTNPVYNYIKFSGQQLCNSDRKLQLEFRFMNRSGTENIFLGSCKTTVADLVDRNQNLELTNPFTRADAGRMIIDHIELIEKPSFIDYLRSGWQINLHVAVDFTASNGESSLISSLHYLGEFNQYEQAIQSVGSILEMYDNDKCFPVYGFGGIPRYFNANSVSHCFNLNGNPVNPDVYGAQGILQAYRTNLPHISLSGPTYFSHFLNQVMNSIKQK